jgi:hypothetical protein
MDGIAPPNRRLRHDNDVTGIQRRSEPPPLKPLLLTHHWQRAPPSTPTREALGVQAMPQFEQRLDPSSKSVYTAVASAAYCYAPVKITAPSPDEELRTNPPVSSSRLTLASHSKPQLPSWPWQFSCSSWPSLASFLAALGPLLASLGEGSRPRAFPQVSWPLGPLAPVPPLFLFLRALPVAQTTMEQWNLTSGAPRTPKKPQAKPQDPGARGGLGGVVLSDKNKLCCSVVIAAFRLGKA